jgi:hypothetical protein
MCATLLQVQRGPRNNSWAVVVSENILNPMRTIANASASLKSKSGSPAPSWFSLAHRTTTILASNTELPVECNWDWETTRLEDPTTDDARIARVVRQRRQFSAMEPRRLLLPQLGTATANVDQGWILEK